LKIYILVFNIYFDYGSMGQLGDINVSFVDLKTIFFVTPPCPMLIAERNLTVPIIVIQNDLIIACIDFIYLTRKLFEFVNEINDYFGIISANKTKINICSSCQFDMMNNNYMNKKRPHFILDPTVPDGGESFVQQMSRLTIEEVD